jgi:hypothetical protein
LGYRLVPNTEFKQPFPLTARDKQEMLDYYNRPQPVVITPPAEVKEPVKPKD